ncbi:unnamed protein product, partial [Oppiella nova]
EFVPLIGVHQVIFNLLLSKQVFVIPDMAAKTDSTQHVKRFDMYSRHKNNSFSGKYLLSDFPANIALNGDFRGKYVMTEFTSHALLNAEYGIVTFLIMRYTLM